jgi:hypothetical protein
MPTNNFLPVQNQPSTLAGSGALLNATQVILTSFVAIDGTTPLTMAMFGTIGFGTLEPGNGTQEEQISFTGITQNANGTAALTGVSTVLFISPYTQTSGLAKSHVGGVIFVISNTSGFYDQFVKKNDDGIITGLITFTQNPIGINPGGQPDASDTTKGVTKLTLAAATPTNPLAVGDNDPRVPTQNENDALAGTGTPSSSNKYVTRNTLTSEEAAFEVLTNKSTNTSLGTSNTLYPSQNAVKNYVDNKSVYTNYNIVTSVTQSSNIRTADDAYVSVPTGSYTKLKEILYNEISGFVNVSFTPNMSGGSGNYYFQIYKNGVAYGAVHTNPSSIVTEALSFSTGDLIQLYGYSVNSYSPHTVGLFDLSYDKTTVFTSNYVTNTVNI